MTSTSMLDRSVKSRRDMAESGGNGQAGGTDSKHFTSLQIFTSFAEPPLNEFFTQKEQQDLEQRQRDEEDKLYRYGFQEEDFLWQFNTSNFGSLFVPRKFLERRRSEEENVARMEEEERDVSQKIMN